MNPHPPGVSGPPAPGRRAVRWRAVLLLLLFFALGAGCGLGGGALWLRARLREALTMPLTVTGPIDRFMARLEQGLARELDLTPEQRAAVREELAVTSREFKQLRVTVADGLQHLTGDTIARIGRHLPQDKQQRLRARAQDRFEPWGLMKEEPERKSDPK